MKKKELKNKIRSVFIEETPSQFPSILNRCQNVNQVEGEVMKRKSPLLRRIGFSFAAAFIFIFGFFAGNYEPSNNEEVLAKEASIYLDVNPSIEIQVDKHNRVYECVANNEDGEKILEKLKIKKVDINTALYAVVGSMYTNGYLSAESNSILVSVQNYSNDNQIILNDISNQIESIFENNNDMDCSIIAQKVEDDEELKTKAEQYSISIGKMKLIEKILNSSNVYTEENIEELANMSIHELNLIYQSIDDKNDEREEIVSGKPGGFIDQEKALEYVINHLEITVDDIEWFDIVALYHHDEKFERKMIYLVNIKLINDEEPQKFIVDCFNGEIMSEDVIEEWEDNIHDFLDKDDDKKPDDLSKPGDDHKPGGNEERPDHK